MIFGDENVTSGASSDLSQATQVARAMVTQYGMSEKVPLSPSPASAVEFISHRPERPRAAAIDLCLSLSQIGPVMVDVSDPAVSSDTKRMVEEEIQALLEGAYSRTQALLKKHSKELHQIATALLEQETLTGDELRSICSGKPGTPKPAKTTKPIRQAPKPVQVRIHSLTRARTHTHCACLTGERAADLFRGRRRWAGVRSAATPRPQPALVALSEERLYTPADCVVGRTK
jgi:hypothetical protein